MEPSDLAEEMLEVLWTELVEHKKGYYDEERFKEYSVLEELLRLGYIEKIGHKKICLTKKGQNEARNCVRRHRLAERLLSDVLDVKKRLIHQTSCKFEHLLHKGIDDSICTLLGHPKTCPHGRSIPEGPYCRDLKSIPKRLIMPLTEVELNRKAKISYLHPVDQSALQKLIAIGALPNVDIVLIQRFPSYVFQLGKSHFAIDKELASQIYVRLM